MNDNNFVIDENGVLISCDGTKTTEILEGVQTIRNNSINCSGNIEVLRLPNSLQTVEAEAFNGCNNLRKLIMPARFVFSLDRLLAYKLYQKYGNEVSSGPVFFSFFASSFSFSLPRNLEEIVVFGEEKELDMRCLDFKRMHPNIIIRIENEVTSIKFGDKIRKNSYKQDMTPKVYVNNYVEHVQIDAPAKWDQKNIIFRAPEPNTTESTDNSVELTLAPRAIWTNDTRWSCPIKINVSAVTYLYPIELGCYESETHQGCKLLLLGNRIEDIPLEDMSRNETYPSIIVWEDYDTVYNKLKAKGWTK